MSIQRAAIVAMVFGGTTLLTSASKDTLAQDRRAPSATAVPQLFRSQYRKPDFSFCNSQVSVDFNGDGRRELLFASRKTGQLQMLAADDGAVVWSRKLAGSQQSQTVYDLDGDGDFEILYSTSGPGRLYVLDHTGELLRQWDSGDSKLGNSAVIVDADGDGRLDGLFGSRYKYLLRLNMTDLTVAGRRSGWVQCGCQTTAMDVDGDGRWDFFAGSGDDSNGKGVLHRYDPVSLKTIWSYDTNDNASSADAVLVDLDGDGQVEIVKSVDNYRGDDAHDAIYAFETDGTLIWKRPGLSGEDSPNAADLQGDGEVEIVGMTFGGEVYCLDSKGNIKWRRDLRPHLEDHDAHAYLTPILCDLDGDRELEILALTNGGYFDASGKPLKTRKSANGIVFALSADGEILDQFDVGGPRYWGSAFVCNVDDDPNLELIVSGSGGLDVIETAGIGPNTEHFQRRRSYQRLNVVPWEYADSYFIYRGYRDGVINQTDNLVLAKADGGYRLSGTFTTELLTLPPGTHFDRVDYESRTPKGTSISLSILDAAGRTLRQHVKSGTKLSLAQPVQLQFRLSTTNKNATPTLDGYRLTFARAAKSEELTLEVAAGKVDRGQTPISFALPKSLHNHKGFRLTRLEDDSAVDVQLDESGSPQIVWILDRPLPAGQSRRYRLAAAPEPVGKQTPPRIVCRNDGKRLVVQVGDQPLLQYNHAVVPSPDATTPYYARSGHLHPVFTPLGKQVTDDFAPDHPHQHGFMFAWTNTTYEGRPINFWDQKAQTGQVEHKKITSTVSGPVSGGFTTVLRHSDLTAPGGAKPVLTETWKLRAYAIDEGSLFDLESTQRVIGNSPLRINRYHYGGPAIRGNRQWLDTDKADFLTSEGKTRKDGNHSRPRWVDLHGPVDGAECGFAILTHPDNFRFPQPVRLHPTKPYFSLSPMVLGEFQIKPRQPYHTRLRFFAHDGKLSARQAERLWNDFADPPRVRIVHDQKVQQ